MAKKGNLYGQINFVSRAKYKKTSIGRNPSTSMQNKSTRKSFKKYRGQGKP